MKNKITKILALVIGMMMVMSFSAMAADTTISVPSDDSHAYAIYQIFTGDLATGENGSQVLSNIHWGANGIGTVGSVVPEETLTEIQGIGGTDGQKAAALSAYAKLDSTAFQTVQGGNSVTVPFGYYLIKDANAAAEGEEATLFIVQVVGPTTIARKAGTTDSDKKVDDVNDSTGEKQLMQTSSDYDIGDDVPYHLTAKLSEKVEQYKKYHITFVDTLEAGKFDGITTPVIKLGETELAESGSGEGYTYTTSYTRGPDANGFTVTIEFTAGGDATLPASLNAKEITIDFEATLGQGAAIGSAGNTNTLVVKYSNNPNDTDGREEGEIPEKKVITFTYKLVVNKVDQNEAPLGGAEFALYKVSSNYKLPTDGDAQSKAADAFAAKLEGNDFSADISGETSNIFTFKGIDDGRYVLVETKTPDGYNTIDPQVFDVVAEHGGTDNKALTLDSLTGNKVSGEIEFSWDKSDEDALKTIVKNQRGSTLPSTGGMGTTIFYVIGGILVLAAAIILISKRRVQQ